MSTESRALQIVEQALAVEDPAARAALVAAACGGDGQLLAEVNALLRYDAMDFSLMPTESVVRPLSVVDAIPERIGPYRVIEEIARGGMGAVVRAERSDGMFQQAVAIKLLRSDLASDRARARFVDERRILGRLHHPGIVRIIDGGDVDGRPWLAMDYIDGAPITRALDAMGATRTARLDAFEAVCAAVIHAHRNLVIHADIKPSNVLMDHEGHVHLLDFGIARLIVALDHDETGDPYPLTRGYAAPERGVGVAPTIASDVFSLGVLLLAMLGQTIPAADVPVRPGTHLPIDASLDGDLGAILARALADAPAERYPDVAELLADVRRARAHEPVVARREAGWRYVAGRFVRRHLRALAIGGLIGALLLGTSIVSTVEYRRADQARALADRRFEDVRQLANYMLTDLNDAMADAPGTVAARERLAAVASRYLDQLRTMQGAPAALQLDTARGYLRLARLQGLSGVASLGRPDVAARSIDHADAILATLIAQHPDDADAIEQRGWASADRWTLAADNGGSVALNDAAARDFARALALNPANEGASLGLIVTQKSRAYDLIWAHRPTDAVPLLRTAIARLRAHQWSPRWQGEAALLEVNMLTRLGDALYYSDDVLGSIALYREADAIVRRHLATGRSVVWIDKQGDVAFNLAGALEDQPGGRTEALALVRQAIGAMQAVLAFGPNASVEKRLLVLYGEAAPLLQDQGQAGAARALSDQSIRLRRARLALAPADPQRRRDLAIGLLAHAQLLATQQDRAAACTAIREDGALWSAIRSAGHLSAHDAATNAPEARRLAEAYCP